MSTGIYSIIHRATGHRYIGSSANISQRLRQHRSELCRNIHHSPFLQRAWNKYGEDAFVFQTLCICEPSMLLWIEQRCLDTLKPEYNCAIYVDAGMRGRTHSESAKIKMAERKRGKLLSAEHRRTLSIAQTGHSVSEETRRKISEKLRGHGVSDETRMKMSIASKNRKKKGGDKISPPSSETD